MSESLQTLVDRAAFLSAEVQQRFGTLIGGSDFDVDFSAAPRLRFSGENPVTFRPHMIGSSVERRAEKTWHWGWDNLNDFPEPVVALSARVRDHGEAHGVPELMDAELPVDSKDLPLALTLAAKVVTGAWAHYPVAAGGGTTVWVLVDDERLAGGDPELKPVVRAIASGITGLELSDHRAALAAYAELRGLRTVPLPEGGVRILCADGSADVTFDGEERIASCQAHQPLEGDAAEQFAAVGPVAGTAVFSPAFAEAEQPVDQTPLAAVVEQDAADGDVAALEPDSVPARDADSLIESEPAAPVGADQPADGVEEPPAVEPRTSQEPSPPAEPVEKSTEPEEKKGFFKRLFGR